MKYRKKPATVEAFQITRETRWDNSDWPAWLHEAWDRQRNVDGSFQPTRLGGGEATEIITLEGIHSVSWGDYIIRGIQGELYPCKPDIFAATYEPVPESTTERGEG